MMFTSRYFLLAGAVTLLSCSYKDPAKDPASKSGAQPGRLIARVHESGFPPSHDTFNGMGTASDGRILYVLCSDLAHVAARMYAFDPATQKVELIGDLSEAAGEKGMNAIAQGTSHVRFVEAAGKLWFATHLGYYNII